jgi:hypothetical protein
MRYLLLLIVIFLIFNQPEDKDYNRLLSKYGANSYEVTEYLRGI